ncbi:MerR family transcriptional regulator [Brevibacillus fluminis]|uniref:MerR family transcriptional regulator n=1 Tax=Brevibacillus fluminis TaxID=511487 RepID=A0A3M8DIM7_9BACL|nr:MerR family transcriptional regulator [Brevibacillus fluminis]RNB87225.1 MerR family transcriptional regulator [Brevibacillus fluminis]
MRIGAFAKQFSVTIETIRYYMELGLLIPVKQDAQYRFHDGCVDDMNWILELKQLRFSMQDIQKIMSFKRISQFADNDDLEYFVGLLQEQKQLLQEESSQLNRSIALLEEKIRTTRKLAPPTLQTGVPLSFIPMLACPSCNQPLAVENASLFGQHLLEARLHCRCGYFAEIKEGILLTSSVAASPMQDYFIYDQDIFPELSPGWISLMEKGSQWIYTSLQQNMGPRQIMLQTNVEVYVFPPKYLAQLPSDTLYVFTANSLMMLKKLKGKLEHLNPKLQVLYIVNNDLRLPLQNGCISLVIDTLSFNDFSLYANSWPLAHLLPYLQEDARIFGTYMYYQHQSRSLQNLHALYPDSHPQNIEPDYIANQLLANGFSACMREELGSLTEPGRYLDYHLNQDRLYLASYQAERIAIPSPDTIRK